MASVARDAIARDDVTRKITSRLLDLFSSQADTALHSYTTHWIHPHIRHNTRTCTLHCSVSHCHAAEAALSSACYHYLACSSNIPLHSNASPLPGSSLPRQHPIFLDPPPPLSLSCNAMQALQAIYFAHLATSCSYPVLLACTHPPGSKRPYPPFLQHPPFP
jgi:hypothetical protein